MVFKVMQTLSALAQMARERTFSRTPSGATAATAAPLSPPTWTVADALVELARRHDVDTEAAALMAGLPRYEGDLDPRLAPIALARVGLDGSWSNRSITQVRADCLPCLAPLASGGVVLIVGAPAAGLLELAQGAETLTVLATDLAPLTTGSVLVVGTADPINGSPVSDERAQIVKSPRKWILAQFLSNRRLLTQLAITAVFLNLCALAIPLYMRSVYDRVVPNMAIESLWALSLGVFLALGFEWAFKNVRHTFVDAIGLRLGQLVQHKVMNSLLNARLSAAPVHSGGVSMALRDIENLSVLMPNALVTLCVDLPFFVLFATVLYLLGGPVVLAAVLGGLALALVGLYANIGLVRASNKSSQLSKARANLIVDMVEGLPAVKAAQAQGRFLRSWDVLSDHSGVMQRQVREWNDLPASAAGFIVQMVTVLVMIIGIFQIKAGALTVGGLVACTLLAGRAMVPISTAVALLSRGYQALSQFVGLTDLLALEPERDSADEAVRGRRIKGAVAFHDVSFAYPGNSHPALKNISISIQAGEKVAIIGRSGSGKSTLMQIIAGLQAPSEGVVLVDGFNVAQYSAIQLREAIAYAAQDPALFDLTVRENVLLGLTNVPEQRIETALKIAGVDQFTSKHPEGLGLKAGARGLRLSGGQRQSIALARALVRDPQVLLLDEPTSAMDIMTEQTVLTQLKQELGSRTLILSTHRMSLLALVDRVIWLDGGKVIADKPRDEVLRLFQGQAGSQQVA
jgi:ATP-binding cassette, subfamily C, bacterial LapB